MRESMARTTVLESGVPEYFTSEHSIIRKTRNNTSIAQEQTHYFIRVQSAYAHRILADWMKDNLGNKASRYSLP
jgi:hypothetical protein